MEPDRDADRHGHGAIPPLSRLEAPVPHRPQCGPVQHLVAAGLRHRKLTHPAFLGHQDLQEHRALVSPCASQGLGSWAAGSPGTWERPRSGRGPGPISLPGLWRTEPGEGRIGPLRAWRPPSRPGPREPWASWPGTAPATARGEGREAFSRSGRGAPATGGRVRRTRASAASPETPVARVQAVRGPEERELKASVWDESPGAGPQRRVEGR